jgi:hypothetical protein
MSLGDDILAKILRRLTSLASFARATFASKRLRNIISLCSYASIVASRIMSLASPVGYFISVIGDATSSFHRALLGSDRDVASIVRYGKFQFADFDDYSWRLMDCRHGHLLLSSDICMAVFDPLAHESTFPYPIARAGLAIIGRQSNYAVQLCVLTNMP